MGSLLTVNQAAERLALKPSTIRKYILQRRFFSVVRIGRAVRLRSEDIERLITEGLTPALRDGDGR